MAKEYKTAKDFRTALETRLLSIREKSGDDIQQLRRHVAFDRLLTRLFSTPNPPWILKGGYAMELRLSHARATKDIDLAMKEAKFLGDEATREQALLELIQNAATVDLSDFFVFTIEPPIMDLDAAPYGGSRFPVEAKMDARSFIKFHLDVGIGDIWIEPFETLKSHDWLEFAGIPNKSFPVIPKEQQFAEKLHAYTLPRERNSRTKDLIDMILLIKTQKLDLEKIKTAIQGTFERRGTHVLNSNLSAPPADWAKPFAALAKESQLSVDLDSAFILLQDFVRKFS